RLDRSRHHAADHAVQYPLEHRAGDLRPAVEHVDLAAGGGAGDAALSADVRAPRRACPRRRSGPDDAHARSGLGHVDGRRNEPDLCSSTTETWTTMAAEQVSRLYHSTAVLLPDARVLVAGGGALPGSAIDQTSAEIYSPPYLFRGTRPTITSASYTLQYGAHF